MPIAWYAIPNDSDAALCISLYTEAGGEKLSERVTNGKDGKKRRRKALQKGTSERHQWEAPVRGAGKK